MLGVLQAFSAAYDLIRHGGIAPLSGATHKGRTGVQGASGGLGGQGGQGAQKSGENREKTSGFSAAGMINVPRELLQNLN